MNRPRIFALVFLAVALVQLALPASRIVQYERTLREGHAFKFRTQTVDPYDAFRGRYVTLRFDTGKANWPVQAGAKPEEGTKVYAKVETGPDGFAKLGSASSERPAGGDYLSAKTTFVYDDGTISIELPFDRFYMEETIAPQAEKVYREHSLQKSARDAYAVVRIREGLGVIEQVFIGDKTLADAARDELREGTK